MRKLAKTSGVHDFVVLLETGMSVNEFCGLTRKDLDFKNRSIRVDHQLIRERGGNFTVPPFPLKRKKTGVCCWINSKYGGSSLRLLHHLVV